MTTRDEAEPDASAAGGDWPAGAAPADAPTGPPKPGRDRPDRHAPGREHPDRHRSGGERSDPHGPLDAADLALPRPPGMMRRWFERHPRIVDWLLVATCVILVVVIMLLVQAGQSEWWEVTGGIASAVVGSIALLRRRRMPLTAALVCGGLALLPLPYSAGGVVAIFVAFYSLGLYSTTLRTWIGYGTVAAASIGLTVTYTVFRVDPNALASGGGPTGLPDAIFLLVPTLLGLSVGNRRRYQQALIDRAYDLARERDQRVRLATADERARIAREMHDVVSHGLTVMVTLSEGAAAQAETGSDRAPAAMRRVAETGREALTEMRRLLGVLREPDADADWAPQPGGDDLATLVERFRAAGLPVRWTREGPPIDGPALQLATFRIVQEALTNALRYASGARNVEVNVENEPERVIITVTDDGRGGSTRGAGSARVADSAWSAGPTAAGHAKRASTLSASATDHPDTGKGHGLIGVRERAALHGGTAEAGPVAGGGWRVRAELGKEEP